MTPLWRKERSEDIFSDNVEIENQKQCPAADIRSKKNSLSLSGRIYLFHFQASSHFIITILNKSVNMFLLLPACTFETILMVLEGSEWGRSRLERDRRGLERCSDKLPVRFDFEDKVRSRALGTSCSWDHVPELNIISSILLSHVE